MSCFYKRHKVDINPSTGWFMFKLRYFSNGILGGSLIRSCNEKSLSRVVDVKPAMPSGPLTLMKLIIR